MSEKKLKITIRMGIWKYIMSKNILNDIDVNSLVKPHIPRKIITITRLPLNSYNSVTMRFKYRYLFKGKSTHRN